MDLNCSYPPTSHSERREQVHSIAFPAIYLLPIMPVFDSPSAPLCLFRCCFDCALPLADPFCEPLFMLTSTWNWRRKTANKTSEILLGWFAPLNEGGLPQKPVQRQHREHLQRPPAVNEWKRIPRYSLIPVQPHLLQLASLVTRYNPPLLPDPKFICHQSVVTFCQVQ